MITASIVTYKTNENELSRVLQCALDANLDLVYVVDNSPTDTLRSIVSQLSSDKILYIYGQGNIGFGSGNNIAIRKALESGSVYHIILNPDIIFDRNAIHGLVSYMQNHEEIGVVVPKLTYPDGRFQASAMLLPSPFVIFARRLMPESVVRLINGRYELLDYDLSVPREVPNVCGCFILIKSETLDKAGLFDERFFMYFEDFDLVRRIHQYAKVVYFPKVSIIHAHAAEHRKNRSLLKASIKSAVQYFNKWGWIFDYDRIKRNKFSLSDKSIILV